MTPAELRDRLIARLCALGLVSVGDAPFVADAALRVVREAMREPSDDILTAMESVPVLGELPVERESRAIYAARLAASPLREE